MSDQMADVHDALTRRRFLKAVAGLAASGPLLAALAQLGCGQQTSPVPSKSVAPASPSSAASPGSAPPSASKAPAVDPAQAAYQKAIEGWATIEAAARKEGRVVITNSANATFWDALRKGFRARYPEIEVEFVGARGPEQRERARTEIRTGTRVVDLSLSTPMSHGDMLGDGSLEAWKAPASLDPANKWVVPPYDATYFSGDGYFAGITMELNGITINTRLVPPAEEPKTWLDVANAKWKGKIIGNPPDRSGGLNWYYSVVRKYGPDYIAKMKATEFVMTDKIDEMVRDTGRGEYAMALQSNLSISVAYMLQGLPLKYIHPQDGALWTPNTIGLVKSPPHPNAARVFLNWLVTREGQQAIVDGAQVPNMLGLKVPHPAMNLEGVNVLKLTKADYEDLNRRNKEARESFGME